MLLGAKQSLKKSYLTAGLCLFAFAATLMGQSTQELDKLKAVYLFNFTKMVSWPANSFSDEKSPIRIAVSDKCQFKPVLDILATNSKPIKGRKVEIIQFSRFEEIEGAHVVYFDEKASKEIEDYQEKLGLSPTLTVGEGSQFAVEGGCLGYVVPKTKLRYWINLKAVQNGKLKMAPQFLRTADKLIK